VEDAGQCALVHCEHTVRERVGRGQAREQEEDTASVCRYTVTLRANSEESSGGGPGTLFSYSQKTRGRALVSGAPLAVSEKDIAWPSDVEHKFANYTPSNFNNDPATRGGGVGGLLRTSTRPTLNGLESPPPPSRVCMSIHPEGFLNLLHLLVSV
jgi:hypothetical protein